MKGRQTPRAVGDGGGDGDGDGDEGGDEAGAGALRVWASHRRSDSHRRLCRLVPATQMRPDANMWHRYNPRTQPADCIMGQCDIGTSDAGGHRDGIMMGDGITTRESRNQLRRQQRHSGRTGELYTYVVMYGHSTIVAYTACTIVVT